MPVFTAEGIRVSCSTAVARCYPGQEALLQAAYVHLLTPVRFRHMHTSPVPALVLYQAARNTLVAEYLRRDASCNPDILLSRTAQGALTPGERTAHLLAQAYADSFLDPMGPERIQQLASRVFTPALRRDPARYRKLSDRYIERIQRRDPRTVRIALARAIDLECDARGVRAFTARDGVFAIELFAPLTGRLARAAVNR